MALSSGTQLGPYTVSTPLGAGGMGEVYRARHATLDREVAIKVLPAHLAADATARARFEREAKAIAALSHPNILAIHDFGVEPSMDGTPPVAYAVMELLQGETLRERLQHGALPFRKVAQFGAEIADGLAAAHDKGIAHRDLKPENVFITSDGRVKILDFGLARTTRTHAEGETALEPHVATATEPGVVLGTIGYMAPEQVMGQPADHRADIFSLGCVLYEMASGRRAFVKATAAETMTAILREDPPELGADSGVRPVAFEAVVRHCLEKRPAERFQSARDLAFALRSLGGWSSASSGASLPSPAARPGRALRAARMAVGAVALFFVGRYSTGHGTVPATPQAVSFTQVTDEPGVETTPSLSPDGKSVVYAKTVGTDSALYLLRVGARKALRLSASAPARDLQPAFSPDGERIAFRSDRDSPGVFLMTASGESVTRLIDFGYFPSWSPRGDEIAVSRATFATPTDLLSDESGLSVVNVRTGQVRALSFPATALQPSWSPSGARIAFWGVSTNNGQRDIWTIAADGSDAASGGVRVTDDAALDWSPTWSPAGDYLYISSTRGGTMNLWRVPIDERSGRVHGVPEPMFTPSTWSGGLSFSRDGARAAFASLDYRSTLMRVPFDAGRAAVVGPAVPILKGNAPIRDHELSPDGEWVAFTTSGVQEDVFIARVDGTEYRRLTDDGFRDRGVAWAPDGTRLAFFSDRAGSYDMWVIRADGSGLLQLTKGVGTGEPVWSPEGDRIAFGDLEWRVIDAVTASLTLPAPQPAVSATDRFLPASWSPASGRIAGLVLPLDGSSTTLGVYSPATRQYARLSRATGGSVSWQWPVWLADGRRVILRRPEGVALVDVETEANRLLVPVDGLITGKSVGISHDNRWITYTETATDGDIWMATIKPGETK